MRLTTVLLIVACLFAAMVMAGPNRGTVPPDRLKKAKKACLKGRKKNGKCVSGKLRVRSADSEDFIEIPDVEDVHRGEFDEE